MGPSTTKLLDKTEFTLTRVLWEPRSGRFTEQDDRVPSGWAVKILRPVLGGRIQEVGALHGALELSQQQAWAETSPLLVFV